MQYHQQRNLSFTLLHFEEATRNKYSYLRESTSNGPTLIICLILHGPPLPSVGKRVELVCFAYASSLHIKFNRSLP